MSFQDTRERIFVNGQIYSRPRFGGRVHGPDTRRFTPDPNPYDVEPETPRYGQGSVDVPDLRDLLFRPTDNFDIRKPVYRPQDKVEVQPLEVATNYTTYTDVLPEDVEMRRRIEDAAEEKSPTIKLDPSKLDLREYRQPGPYRPGEDLDRDRFIKSYRSPIASNPETGKRDFFYQYLEQNKEVIGPRTQMFDRFADPDDGTLTAGMPRYIRGHQYAPRGVIMTVPDIDSRIFNERVKRGYVPMTPPPSRGAGPQLPGFV